MFSGIVEASGKVESVLIEGFNKSFWISAHLDEPLKVDQSISHNGVCLTVTEILPDEKSGIQTYSVTAIHETLQKTNLEEWIEGSEINLERCLKTGQRLDGHFVQGHVDTTGILKSIESQNGSWLLTIQFPADFSSLIVAKGSICINGVSLTVVDALDDELSVAIIPYTWEHTNFHLLQTGNSVNLEFDILGKYIFRSLAQSRSKND